MKSFVLLSLVTLVVVLFSCNPHGACENPEPSTVEGVVVDDSTSVPIEGCHVLYEAESYGECHGYNESDSDMTDENGKFRLDNYYSNTQGAGYSFSKDGYGGHLWSGDTVRLLGQ